MAHAALVQLARELSRLQSEQKSELERAGRPFVTLSFAQSLDGCLSSAPGERVLLSGPESLRMTHFLRSRHDAILVGSGTVLTDDPELTVRLVPGDHPRPIVLDSALKTPPSARLFKPRAKMAWLVAARDAAPAKARALEERGAAIIEVDKRGDGLDLAAMLRELKRRDVASVMVEGGARVVTSFLASGLVDFVVVTIAPLLLGRAGAVRYEILRSELEARLDSVMIHQLGEDIVLAGAPRARQANVTVPVGGTDTNGSRRGA